MRDLAEILEVSKGIAEQAVAKLREEGLMCGHAQLARCLLKGLSLQKATEIIQLIKYLPTLFNLSHFLEWYVLLFSKKGTAIVETLKIGEHKPIIKIFLGSPQILSPLHPTLFRVAIPQGSCHDGRGKHTAIRKEPHTF